MQLLRLVISERAFRVRNQPVFHSVAMLKMEGRGGGGGGGGGEIAATPNLEPSARLRRTVAIYSLLVPNPSPVLIDQHSASFPLHLRIVCFRGGKKATTYQHQQKVSPQKREKEEEEEEEEAKTWISVGVGG